MLEGREIGAEREGIRETSMRVKTPGEANLRKKPAKGEVIVETMGRDLGVKNPLGSD